MLAGVIASLAAYIVNSILGRAMPRGNRNRGLSVLVSPLLEEGVKTMAGTLVGGPLVITHGVFGVVEGFHDMSRPSKRGIAAALLSIASHLLFGLAATLAVSTSGEWWWGVVAAYPIHAFWNHFVLSVSPSSPRR